MKTLSKTSIDSMIEFMIMLTENGQLIWERDEDHAEETEAIYKTSYKGFDAFYAAFVETGPTGLFVVAEDEDDGILLPPHIHPFVAKLGKVIMEQVEVDHLENISKAWGMPT